MRKALLVGINDYPRSPLRGCVNDVLLVHKMITEHFQFNPVNIRVLTDQEATKRNILWSLKKLVAGAEKGDTILFHYSGHGSQVVVNDWTNNSEVDGRDEILCPVDLNWNDPLRDNDLGEIFRKVPDGVKILVLLDCCHSGTGLRIQMDGPNQEISDIRNRFLPPPPSNILSNPEVSIDDDLNFVFPVSRDLQAQKKSFLVTTVQDGEVILMSGCQDNQTSADAYLGGTYRGAFTFAVFNALKEANFNISYRNLITSVNENLDMLHYTQNPQLECVKGYENKSFLR